MVDRIAVRILFSFENSRSESAVVTGNAVRMLSNVCTFGKMSPWQSPKAPVAVFATVLAPRDSHCCFQISYSPSTMLKGSKKTPYFCAAGKISCQVDSLTKQGRILVSVAIFC